MLEWLLRTMPTGGADFQRPDWSERECEELAARFLAGPDGRPHDNPDGRSIVDSLIDFRSRWGWGDPLRWSPTAVEILLTDWYPRKIVADLPYLKQMPGVLRAFVRFAHSESGIPRDLTEEAMEAIDDFEPDFCSIIASPRRQGPAALLERMGALPPLGDHLDDFGDDEDLDDEAFGDDLGLIGNEQVGEIMTAMLADQVGGPEVLAQLDAHPLPDEDFDWSGVRDEIRDGVSAVVELSDAACAEFFDIQHRTAVRRLVHDVAVASPGAFRRGKPETAAAAACWLIGRANDSVGYEGLPAADLMAHFGLSSTPATRADTMRRAVGGQRRVVPGSLGSARYLTSDLRANLIEVRDTL
jgi:hypothetical protein